jgi:hypothetical protein
MDLSRDFMDLSEERRPAVRVPVNLPAKYGRGGFVPEGPYAPVTTPAVISELSTSGLRVRTSEVLRPGEFVYVAFSVVGRHRRTRHDLRLIVRLVRVVSSEPPAFAYAFALVEELTVAKLRDAVLSLSLRV